MTTQTDTKPQTLSSAQIQQDQHAYAIACCQKGLLETLPDLSFHNPETVAEAFLATLIARPKNANAVLSYLWDNHPYVSWNEQPILSRLITVAPKLAPKIFAHVFETDPLRMRLLARNVGVQALRTNTPDLLIMVLPYLNARSLGDLIKHACESKQLSLIKMVVEAYPIDGNLDFLKDLSSKHQHEVQCVFNEMQSRRIHGHIGPISHSRAPSATRKM